MRCQCHHDISEHEFLGSKCNGQYYGPCTCEKFRPLEQFHFYGDGCKNYHGTALLKFTEKDIREKFNASLHLEDHGIPLDYGGSRFHETNGAFEANNWLQRNARSIVYSLLYTEDE